MTVTDNTPPVSPEAAYLSLPPVGPLLDLNFGFVRARALDTALELRVFTHIAAGATTAAAVAQAAACSERGIERLLGALVGLGLLTRGAAGYALTPLADAYLVEERPGYVGPHLRAVMDQWSLWENLTEAVRSGEPVRDIGAAGGRSQQPDWFGHLLPLIFAQCWQAAGQIELAPGARVLDVAAGDGSWSVAIALRHPQARVLAQDEPAILERTRERVRGFGVEKRVSYHEAPPEELPRTEGPFELIIVSHVCRLIGPERSRTLLQNCFRLLSPGGSLVVGDVLANAEYTGPAPALMINLSMLLNTRKGEVVTEDELRGWLSEAGFRRIERLPGIATPLVRAWR